MSPLPSPPTAADIAALWEDQRRRWQTGERPPVEAYLPTLPTSNDLIVDLIYGEFVLRREAGERPTADEYARRFPQLADAIRRQLALHDAVAEPAETVAPPTASPTADACPAEIAGYRVVAALGEGGQGRVYRGVHPTLGRDVVLKVGVELVGREGAVALAREGRILAELDHPGLARIYDLRSHDGRPCLVMEYVPGVHLEQYAHLHPFDARGAARLVARLARALATAHRRGVVHRDVKPKNVVIDDKGDPRLIDFGLASREDAWRAAPDADGRLSGTLAYMAPEQARGEPTGPAADVFALGGVLYYLLTGRAPYAGTTLSAVLDQASRGAWDRKPLRTAPTRLARVVERAMAVDPADRYVTADALAAELETFARPPRFLALVAVSAAALLLTAVAIFLVAKREERDPHVSTPPTSERRALAPSLTVRVAPAGDKERFIDLTECLSVRTGNEVRVEATVPPGAHAALFLFDSGGALRRLTSAAPADDARPITCPEPGEVVPIQGVAGTEVVLLVVRQSAAVEEGELREFFSGVWESLPMGSLLRLTPDGVKAVGTTRALGAPRRRDDPEDAVKRRLDDLRKRLLERFDHVEGLAFAHGD